MVVVNFDREKTHKASTGNVEIVVKLELLPLHFILRRHSIEFELETII